ncbi:Sapep family Mn(2+)-dependent dipeptidase [Clostridium niameyense]|uniref:Sapep family Mn(2+)-dependent dipeptidase n=1 Tax=Clostridium niameyense TaxID=1622073 RepID=UPI000B186058|nr:Sapep family Mn(2+)-dependent dipeptidase [Clostridium niameyense]
MQNHNIKRLIKEKEEDIKNDISELVKIPSIRDLNTKSYNAPFGLDIRNAFDKFIEFGNRDNFKVEDFDGYAIHLECGEGSEIIGILGHLDVVPIFDKEEWDTDPFQLVERSGYIYGRGVNDDKGPLVAALYALKIIKELDIKFKRRVRLIIGGAEETTWECMEHYFSKNPQPKYGFSPDGDFPIVNGEKGIFYYSFKSFKNTDLYGIHNLIDIKTNNKQGFVCDYCKVSFLTNNALELREYLKEADYIRVKEREVTAIYSGKNSLSRNPHKGINALFKFGRDLNRIKNLNNKGKSLAKLLDEYFIDSIYGEKVGLQKEDSEMGSTTMCLMDIYYSDTDFEIKFDFRYPKNIKKEFIKRRFEEIATINNLKLSTDKELDFIYVDENSELIKSLKKAYENVIGEEPSLFSKGAASYARVLNEGVAFGPTMPGDTPNSHKSNENIKLETLYKAIEIYCQSIYLLACK